MKVLLAADQSRNSLTATHWVQGLHLSANLVVYVLNIVEILQWPKSSAFDDANQFRGNIAAVREKATTKARRFISCLVDSLSRPRLEVRTDGVKGIPGAEILTAIDQHQIDLVTSEVILGHW